MVYSLERCRVAKLKFLGAKNPILVKWPKVSIKTVMGAFRGGTSLWLMKVLWSGIGWRFRRRIWALSVVVGPFCGCLGVWERLVELRLTIDDWR